MTATAQHLLTMQEAADQLRISKATAIRAAKAGKLTVVRLGLSARAWRVHPADLEAFIAESRRQPCQSQSVAPRGRSLSVTPARPIVDLLRDGPVLKLVKSKRS